MPLRVTATTGPQRPISCTTHAVIFYQPPPYPPGWTDIAGLAFARDDGTPVSPPLKVCTNTFVHYYR